MAYIIGTTGSEYLEGTSSADWIQGLEGVDSLYGGADDDFLHGGADGDRIEGGTGVDWLIGDGGNDLLFGNDGIDRIDGGAGADEMHGGPGNDSFFVNTSYDRVYELADEGVDLVVTSTSYTLPGGVENLTLDGGKAINGAGNGLANLITGNPSHNRLDGGGGADRMVGLGGHDVYVVDHRGDSVVEFGAQGFDTVRSAISLRLPLHFEKLILTGSAGRDGRGNGADNIIIGNSGGNLLSGGGGNDIVDGGAGDDLVYGHVGSDTLTGGAGRDRFLFNVAPGSSNVDAILDFSPSHDVINLAEYIFTRAGPRGTLSDAAFQLGTVAADASDRIVYDPASGQIFYDRDGVGGAGQVLFATVDAGTPLTSADFVVYG
jgi:Ca2+-binding RTX toxin-like protein